EFLLANPLHLGPWMKALAPIRASLIGPLSAVFRGKKLKGFEKEDFTREAATVLADLLFDADLKQDAILRSVLMSHHEKAIQRMRRELTTVAQPTWKDPPLDPSWTQPTADVKRAIESAGGLLAERFALCQSL